MTFFDRLSKCDRYAVREEISILESYGFENVTLLPVERHHAGAYLYSADYSGLSVCGDSATFSFFAQLLCPDNVRSKLNLYKSTGATEEFQRKVQETSRVLIDGHEREEREHERARAEMNVK